MQCAFAIVDATAKQMPLLCMLWGGGFGLKLLWRQLSSYCLLGLLSLSKRYEQMYIIFFFNFCNSLFIFVPYCDDDCWTSRFVVGRIECQYVCPSVCLSIRPKLCMTCQHCNTMPWNCNPIAMYSVLFYSSRSIVFFSSKLY